MNRPIFILAGAAVLVAALAVALWPSDQPSDGLGLVAGTADEEEFRAEAPAQEVPDKKEDVQREELDPSLLGITDPLIVTVLDEFERPVSDVTIAITSPGELPIWVIDGGRKTDSGGRAVFDRAQVIAICEESGWDEVVLGVWDWSLRGYKVEQRTRLRDLQATMLELPGVPQILVRLHGFPDGVGPILSPVAGSPNDTMELTGIRQQDGWWRFDEPPLGEAWELWYARVDVDDVTGTVTGEKKLRMPSIEFVGPTVPGEITKAESNLFDMPVVVGRMVDEEGKELRLGRNADYLSVTGINSVGDLEIQRFEVEYFRGGGFLAWPRGSRESGGDLELLSSAFVNLGYISERPARGEAPKTLGLHEIQKLHIAWSPEDGRGRIESARLAVGRAATLPMPIGQPGVDLGEVTLSADNYLVKFLVVNEAGEPVNDADLELSLAVDGERRGLRSSLLKDLETDADGEAWLLAPSWELVQRSATGDDTNGRRLAGLRVEVESREYLAHEEVIAFGTREVTFTLTGGGQLRGSLAFSEDFEGHFQVRAFATDDRERNQRTALDSAGVRSWRGQSEFQMGPLPEGVVDLSFEWAWGDWPVYQLRAVPVTAGQMTEVQGLPTRPFDQTLRWIEVVMPEGLETRSVRYATVTQERRGGEAFHSMAMLQNRAWVFPLPLGANSWTGTFEVSGFQTVQVRGLGPGRHELELKPVRAMQLKLAGGAAGFESEWLVYALDRDGEIIPLEMKDGGLRLPGATARPWQLSWHRKGSGGFDHVGDTTVTLTEADLERGEIAIEPPPGW